MACQRAGFYWGVGGPPRQSPALCFIPRTDLSHGQSFISVARCHAKFDIKLSALKQKILKIASLCLEGKNPFYGLSLTFPCSARDPVNGFTLFTVLLLAKLAGFSLRFLCCA